MIKAESDRSLCAGAASGHAGVRQPQELAEGHEAGVRTPGEPPGQGQVLPGR